MKFKILTLVACLLGTGANSQTAVDIPIDDARMIATQALQAGDLDLARQIAEALLRVDPDDRTALLVIAVAAPHMGDATAGRQAGSRAWTLSETDAQKYEAARLTALAAANEERFTLATFWLRRALTVVPNEEERARTIKDARQVSRINPWSTQFRFSVVPSNNVNGGARDETLTAPGLPDGTLSPEALALSGLRATLNFRTQYRLAATEKSRTTVALQYQASRVRLDDDSIDADTFSTAAANLTLGHDRVLQTGSASGRLTFGTFEYGGDPYYDFKRLSLDRRIPISDNTGLQLSVQRERQTYESTGIGEVDRYTQRAGLSQQLASGDSIGGALTYTISKGDSVNYTYDDWSLQGSYAWAEPFGPVSLSVGGGIRWSDYPAYNLIGSVDGGREDKSAFYNVNIGFPDIEYAGFSPGLAINGSLADSNVSRFSRGTFSVALTINSAF